MDGFNEKQKRYVTNAQGEAAGKEVERAAAAAAAAADEDAQSVAPSEATATTAPRPERPPVTAISRRDAQNLKNHSFGNLNINMEEARRRGVKPPSRSGGVRAPLDVRIRSVANNANNAAASSSSRPPSGSCHGGAK